LSSNWCTAAEGSDLGRAIEYADTLKADRGMSEDEAMQEAWERKMGYVVHTPGLDSVYDCEWVSKPKAPS